MFAARDEVNFRTGGGPFPPAHERVVDVSVVLLRRLKHHNPGVDLSGSEIFAGPVYIVQHALRFLFAVHQPPESIPKSVLQNASPFGGRESADPTQGVPILGEPIQPRIAGIFPRPGIDDAQQLDFFTGCFQLFSNSVSDDGTLAHAA